MASGIARAGVDLDSLFLARVSAKIADVGYRVAGVDISNRYEGRGGTTAIANTGLTSVGVDLASLFRNISAPLVALTARTASASAASIGATATYALSSTGDILASVSSSNVVDVGDWISPQSGMAGYAVFASRLSGVTITGTLDTWLALSSSRSWTITRSTTGTSTATMSVQIRRISDSVVVAGPVTITFQASLG